MKKIWLGLLLLSAQLIVAQSVYVHNFGSTTISAHPYTVAPGTFDANLSNSSWSNSTNAWTSFAGSSGQAIALNNSGGTPTITLTFSVAACYDLTISSYSFWRQRSTSGAQNWSMTINGNAAGSGTVPTTGANTGNITTGLPLTVNGSVSIVLSLSGASGTGTFRLDDFTLNGVLTNTCCVAASEPTTNASASTSSDLGCNAGKVSWTNGNGSGRLVVLKASSAPSAPTDGTTYTANTLFGSGSSISGGFVVFNGTASEVFVTGLSASTTYFWNVYEYNGNGSCINYTPTGSSGSFTTTSCSTPLGITAIYIDACPSTCTYEGNNEIIFGQTGSYGLKVNTNGPVVQYNSTSPPTTTFISTYTTNSTNISTLNTATSPCASTVFVDPNVQGYIPPNSKFMIANNCMCSPSAYDFSGLCNQTIYVVFGTNAAWPCNSAGGIFGNAGGCTPPADLRYTEVDFNNWGVNTLPIYSYDICQLTGTGNGDYALFDPAGGAATSYGNSSCTVPLIVLPVEIVSFTSEKVNRTSELKWKTASEKDLSKILVQRSADGFNYQTLAQLLPSNSENGSEYSFTDEQPLNGKNYYRIKFQDNGERIFTSAIQMEDFAAGVDIYFSEGILYMNPDKKEKLMRFSLYDISGREILTGPLQGETSSFDLGSINCTAGVYIVKVFSGDGVRSVKKIVVR